MTGYSELLITLSWDHGRSARAVLEPTGRGRYVGVPQLRATLYAARPRSSWILAMLPPAVGPLGPPFCPYGFPG